MTDFNTWSRENLVQFAEQSLAEIQALKQDLKIALNAYREINTKEKENE